MMIPALLLAACVKSSTPVAVDGAQVDASPGPSAELAAFFGEVHAEELAANPIRAAYLGLPHDDTVWTPITHEHAQERYAAAQGHLATLRARFDPGVLSAEDQLSYVLFEQRQEENLAEHLWWWHGYRVNQMWGTHTFVPSFLMTVHRIDSEATARSWVARVRGVPAMFDDLVAILAEQESRGILPPAFVYPHVQGAIDKLLTGAPFTGGEPSPLLAHFEREVAGLGLEEATEQALVADATAALHDELGPAYRALQAALAAQEPTEEAGVWKLPDGADYYALRLRHTTTTDLTAEEIHALGLSEVARIHGEMRALMPALGVEGDLPELFAHLRGDPSYTLPNTDEGREQYLELARGYVAGMEARLPEVFDLLPQKSLEVRRVEPFREGSAGKAFYQRASTDGVRPGIFYANLRDMANMPTYQLEALVYHEGIPGHHMQNAVSMELSELPPFRRFGGYTAYGEGWGLYSEFLPKELGFYEDPASDVGRLAMELWRAARLVVDTGIHDKRWTRQEAIDYLQDNTPNPVGDCVHAIERYIVAPGQATAYKVGMLEILRLREKARAELGEAFTLTAFHRAILGAGPLPLDLLEARVEAWIAQAG